MGRWTYVRAPPASWMLAAIMASRVRRLAALLALSACWTGSACRAQEIEPRSYSPSPSGVNFLIMAFVMLTLRRLWKERFVGVSWRFLPISMGVAYVATVIANAMRIVIALEIQRRSVEVSWLNGNQLHRLEGIVVYFGFLMLLFVLMERRLLIFPVVIYYVMTLGVPLINGAFHRAGFWEHFAFVMVIPLVVMVPVLIVRLVRQDYRMFQDLHGTSATHC